MENVRTKENQPALSVVRTCLYTRSVLNMPPRDLVFAYCCQSQIQTMNSPPKTRPIQTRNSSRAFGLNLTNLPSSQPLKKPKQKPRKSSFATQWLQSLPQVQPYLQEINAHTLHFQHQSYIPEDFMPRQPELTTSMRETLMAWIVEVHQGLCHNPHTLYLAVLIIDKYCLRKPISRSRYQLLGITAIFVAAKYEEVKIPKLRHYYQTCGGEYSFQEILSMESEILILLNFKIKAMTCCWYIEQYLQLAGIDGDDRVLCMYLLDLAVVDFQCCKKRPALLCWGIVLFAIRHRNLRELSQQEIQEQYRIQEGQLKGITTHIADLFLNRRQKRFKTIQNKYMFSIGHITT